ncbi:hypothetical protein [Streptomyces sp. NPDC095613]|uniref:hypothetical protein n=1 Tax=Streptomyces sp. NPDC095613 TaxID=3155540 RepID=UPI00333229C8
MRRACARTSGKVTALGAAAVLVLSLAACDAAGTGGDGTGDASSASPSSSPSPTPTVDPAAYRQALDTALSPLDSSLRAVDRAREGGALNEALGRASAAATDAATALETARTPDDAVVENTGLASSLRDLSRSLDDARADRGRCATSPRVELGGAGSLTTVRDVGARLEALGYPVHLTLPRTEKPKHRRLGNGTMVKDSRRSGLGRLTIDNGTSSDAVVSLTRGKKPAFTVYVRKGTSATVRRVEDGSYTVYFTSGEDWNTAKKSFTRECSFQKFDDEAGFRTVSVTGGTQYTVLTFSLAKTVGGNATTTEVPADEFPS